MKSNRVIPSLMIYIFDYEQADHALLHNTMNISDRMKDDASYVAYHPHQVAALRFALHLPLSIEVIHANEGGLGKTIEASLVIAQFKTEEIDDRVRNGKAPNDHEDSITAKPVTQKGKDAGGERADG